MSELHGQIDRLIEVRRYDDARRLLQAAFSEAPDDPEAHAQAARIAYYEDDNALAGSHLRDALASDPTHVDARFLRHLVLVDEREFSEAERAILELIREFPREAQFIATYARLMLTTAHLKKSRALVEEALRLEPDNRDARIVATLLATVDGDRSLANEQLADLVRQHPECLAVAGTLYNVLIEQGRMREAQELGRELLRTHPDDEDLVDGVIELRIHTHWLAAPTWPLQRWGWAGSIGMWVAVILILGVLRERAPAAAGIFAAAYMALVIYSWAYPPLMRRWLRWRGI